MKRKLLFSVVIFIWFGVIIGSCDQKIQTVEVTRNVPQTVVVTQMVTEMIKVGLTTTPMPIFTPTPTITLTQSPQGIHSENVWTPMVLTPGLQLIEQSTRPEVEKIMPAEEIKAYLAMSYSRQSLGGKVFCGYQPIGMGNDGSNIRFYLWMDCVEYSLVNQSLIKGSEINEPITLFVNTCCGSNRIMDSWDAGEQLQRISVNFPPQVREVILRNTPYSDALDKDIAALSQALEQEAKTYFGE